MQGAWPYPRVIAHRGAGALAPENTLAALHAAKARGFLAVEFDVMLSADGVPVLIHDETLERTTNGRGRVAETAYADLARLDAGSWFGPAFAGERIPRLREAALLCRELGLWANVEIKPAPGHEAQTGSAVAALAAELWRGDGQAPLLSSFAPAALAAARSAAPQLARGLVVREVTPGWEAALGEHACVSLHCDYRRLAAPLAREVKQSGHGLACYTVNEPDAARTLLAWGVDALFTDRLDAIGPHFAGRAG